MSKKSDQMELKMKMDAAVKAGAVRMDNEGVYRLSGYASQGGGQYAVDDPTTGEIVGYQRATTFLGVVADKSGDGLKNFMLTNAMIGAANNPEKFKEYSGKVRGKSYDDIKADRALSQYNRAAVNDFGHLGGGDVKREWGTLMHAVVQAWEESARTFDAVQAVQAASDATAVYAGAMHGLTFDQQSTEERLVRDLRAYIQVMSDFTVVECEQMGVIDELGVAGKLDLLVKVPEPVLREFPELSGHLIADIKTGESAVQYPFSVSVQEALYTLLIPYSPEFGRMPRDESVDINTEWGLIISLPGNGVCNLLMVYIGDATENLKTLIPPLVAWQKAGTKKNLLRPITRVQEPVPVPF